MDLETARAKYGNVAMHALRNQAANLAEISERIEAAETMLRGLPNIVSAMGEIVGMSAEEIAALQAMLDAADAEGEDAYDVVSGAERTLAVGLKTTLRQQQIMARSVCALAKTQLGLARACQHYGSMLLIWTASQDSMKAAAELGNKMGRGNDALREFARQKFGDALTGHAPKKKKEEGEGDGDQ